MRPPAVIVDRDGTLASVAYVRPEDKSALAWAQFNSALPFDAPVPSVVAKINLLRAFIPGLVVIMVSGRAGGDYVGDRSRLIAMEGWVRKHSLPIDLIFMREGGDTRRDSIVKDEIYRRFIRDRFDVLIAIDDRPQVIEVWRSHGIPVIEVTDPCILPPICGKEP